MTWRLRGVWLIAVLAVDGCSAPSPSPTAVAPIPHLAPIQVQSQRVHTAPRNVRLSAIGIYTDDTRQILTSGVAWRCSEPNVATVSDAGVATFVTDGTAIFTATSQDKSGSVSVSVPPDI